MGRDLPAIGVSTVAPFASCDPPVNGLLLATDKCKLDDIFVTGEVQSSIVYPMGPFGSSGNPLVDYFQRGLAVPAYSVYARACVNFDRLTRAGTNLEGCLSLFSYVQAIPAGTTGYVRVYNVTDGNDMGSETLVDVTTSTQFLIPLSSIPTTGLKQIEFQMQCNNNGRNIYATSVTVLFAAVAP